MAKNEIAIPETKEFALFKGDVDILPLIEDNLAGEDFSPFDLEQIRVPSGGFTAFEINTPQGADTVKAIFGIILTVEKGRNYWESGLEEGGAGSPPDCASRDGIIGIGNPGGECRTCPLNEYKSAKKGEGKACKEIRNVFLLTPGMVLPYNLVAPPTSLKGFKKYAASLTSFGKSINGVITKVSLVKDKNHGGIEYSKLVFEFAGDLTPEQTVDVRKFRDLFKKSLGSHIQAQANPYGETQGQAAADNDAPNFG